MSPTPSLPSGSWILVTGASGFLASHICLQLLQRGYKVRGTVRNPSSSAWLLNGRFKTYADAGAMELAAVPDFTTEDAYNEAIKEISGIMHVAYVASIVPDPNEVITPSVKSVRAIFNAAVREPSVKEVVFTGSGINTSPLTLGIDNGTITRDSWNDAALEAAWAPPPYDMARAMVNYPASKIAAEKEVWKLVEENDTHFNVNVVSPAGLIGEPLTKKHVDGLAGWVIHVYRGNKAAMEALQSTYYADVKDEAAIHIGAILDPDVKNARIQAWGELHHWNEFLALIRTLRPEKEFEDGFEDPKWLQVEVDQRQAVELLRKWSGREGWIGYEQSVRENIETPFLED